MILYVYAIYCFGINRSLLSESFTSYQQKETGEITTNQRIRFRKTTTTTNQTLN